MKSFQSILAKSFSFFSLAVSYLLLATNTYADDLTPKPWENSNGDIPASFADINFIIQRLLGIMMSLAGVTIFVMLIKGGYTFMTSGGDPKANEAAKGTITWAIIGLVALLAIWIILLFIKEFTGVDVTTFGLPTN
jgi:hypothetical protein